VKTPPFFDAHCDTVLKVADEGVDFVSGSPSTHIVLSERYPGDEAERADALLATLETMVSAAGEAVRVTRTGGELRSSFAVGEPIAALVGMEGADPLEGRAENLRSFYRRGVRDLILAWKDNAFAGTAFGRDMGLSREGERLVGLCEDLGVMVDVSHLSDSSFADVCRVAARPFVASHSNCRAVCPSGRNLTDEMIRALADRGGVMGINLSSSFLSPAALEAWQAVRRRIGDAGVVDWREQDRRAREAAPGIPRPPFEWVMKHALHAVDVGGEDVVGLGGDLDGIIHLPAGIDGVEDYPKVPAALRAAGLSDRQIEKLCFGNFLRVFEEILCD
jgi:membrane dipeptidase